MIEAVLLPRPRELRPLGGGPARLEAEPQVERDRGLPAQGYTLRAGPEGVEIRFADEAGLRYARATLSQLRQQPQALAALEIRDWPDFAVRGYMLDVSRDRVPTRATLERIVEVLDVDDIAADSEVASIEFVVVAVVLDLDKIAD